jgi:molecular chaperone DnaK (HSP70)
MDSVHEDGKIPKSEVHDVVLTGGSGKIPKVRALLALIAS